MTIQDWWDSCSQPHLYHSPSCFTVGSICIKFYVEQVSMFQSLYKVYKLTALYVSLTIYNTIIYNCLQTVHNIGY